MAYYGGEREHYRDYDGEDPRSGWEPPTDYTRREEMEMAEGSQGESDDIRKKTFSGLLGRFATKTSMIGIGYIHSAKIWYARLIWCVLTLAAVALTVLHMYYLIALYQQNDKKTQIDLKFSSLQMPAVTICNTNPVRESMTHRDGPDGIPGMRPFSELMRQMDPNKMQRSDKGNNPPGGRQKRQSEAFNAQNKTAWFNPDQFRKKDKVAEQEQKMGQQDPTAMLKDQFKYLYTNMSRKSRYEIGHQLQDMMVSATFSGRMVDNKKFKLSPSNDYGNCFTLKDENYTVEKNGPRYGLTLIMFLEKFEYIPAMNRGTGFRLSVHAPDTADFPTDEGIYIAPRTETDIGLKQTMVERMEPPYGDCEPRPDYITDFGLTYTKLTCQQFCKQLTVEKECNCFNEQEDDIFLKMNHTGLLAEVRHCGSESEMQCLYDIEDNWIKLWDPKCGCANSCTDTIYSKTISFREWPVSQYAPILRDAVCEKEEQLSMACRRLRENVTNDAIAENFVKVNIYFEELNYEVIQEMQDYEFVQFISDVGGAVGLWVGLSILSLFELVQLMVELGEFGFYRCCGVNVAESHKHKKYRNVKKPSGEKEQTIQKSYPEKSRHSSNATSGSNGNWPPISTVRSSLPRSDVYADGSVGNRRLSPYYSSYGYRS